MRHLVIDTSSVLWMSLLAGKSKEFGYEVEHNGKTVWVNGWEHGLDAAISHITAVARELEFSAGQMVFVVEGGMSKARRTAMYPGYKENRGSRAKEAYDEFNTCRTKLIQEFMNAGATIVRQDGVEGDDVIAYMCGKLEGEKVILSQDGDMAALISDNVALFRNGSLVKTNPFGPFDFKHIPVYKALVGDSSDGIKGCPGFGDKAFLDLLVWGGNGVLPAMRGAIEAHELHTLEDDVAGYRPMRKIIDNAQAVYASYDVALLRPEWVNTERVKLEVQKGSGTVSDDRVVAISSSSSVPDTFSEPEIEKQHYVFDCELIGTTDPVFLVCFEGIESGEKLSFWHHVPGDMDKMKALLQREDITFVSFNGIHFDQPLLWAALSGLSTIRLKQLANHIITEGKSFGTSEMFGYTKSPTFDHIDLMEVTPGVKISLKTYAGRIGFETMVDMPFDHTDDLEDAQLPILEAYCQNDLGVTKALFNMLHEEIKLRKEIGAEHKLDLRSKSDAQLAEAVLKKVANIKSKPDVPLGVTYTAPPFIQTESTVIRDIIERIEAHTFKINQANGSPEAPEFLSNPIELGYGTYQMGIGGLHSTHDNKLYVEADDETMLIDIDVASYYPSLIIKSNLIPKIENGNKFISAYKEMFDTRVEAKRNGNKKVANSLKISLNGTYGKLGQLFCPFYSPDLLLAVTLTGQLNLLCLIHEIETESEGKAVIVSANTDGIVVKCHPNTRDFVLRVVHESSRRTSFEYEETVYKVLAMKDVNNYLAVTAGRDVAIISPEGIRYVSGKEGVIKRKGLYAESGLMKNPTFEVCSDAVAAHLKDGSDIAAHIRACTDIRKFVSIRNITGGGLQYDSMVEADEWYEVEPGQWSHPGRKTANVKRKSRPAPYMVGVGGTKCGRVARWYMGANSPSPIFYVKSGNKVPQTEGARLCMNLPKEVPRDIDYDWYINYANEILSSIGAQDGKEIQR